MPPATRLYEKSQKYTEKAQEYTAFYTDAYNKAKARSIQINFACLGAVALLFLIVFIIVMTTDIYRWFM